MESHHLQLQYNSSKHNTTPNSVGKEKVPAPTCFICTMHRRLWIASCFPQVGHSVKPRCLGGRLDYFLSRLSRTVWGSEMLRFGPPGNTVLYSRHYYVFG